MRIQTLALPLLAALSTLGSACGHGPPGDPHEAPRPLVILVSLDGFRWDYPDLFATLNLDRLSRDGVRAERMIPSFPSKTFPNHYTLVTGLYPSNHGLVANNVYDPVFDATFKLSLRDEVAHGRWWGGEPVWVTAEKNGLPTAPLFWPGSEAEIGGRRPTHWAPYDDDLPNEERVARLLGWLDLPEAERPAFLTLYFSDVDSAGHDRGPDSPELAAAVARVDADLGLLLDGLEERGLLESANVLVVADHGMAPTSRERVIAIDDYVDRETANPVDWSPVLGLWPAEEDREAVYRALAGAHPHLQVYRREEVPERLRYRDHRRIPPIVGIADEGWSITDRRRLESRPESFDGGTHGYDPEVESMGAVFIASGPGFRQGATVAPFENVHVYALLCHLLGIAPAPNDGSLEAVRGMLREEPADLSP